MTNIGVVAFGNALILKKGESYMEIINPGNLPGVSPCGCTSDIFAPPHPCYDGGGNSPCPSYDDNGCYAPIGCELYSG